MLDKEGDEAGFAKTRQRKVSSKQKDEPSGAGKSRSRASLSLPLPFEEVVNRHGRELMAFLARAAGESEAARELFQETFLRAYHAYPRLREGANVRAYLYAIASNLLRNRARDGARRARVIAQHEVPASADERFAADDDGARARALNPAAHHRDLTEAVLHLRALIARLPEKQRQALLMRRVAGLTYEEIAQALGCSVEAARAHVSLATRKLKAQW